MPLPAPSRAWGRPQAKSGAMTSSPMSLSLRSVGLSLSQDSEAECTQVEMTQQLLDEEDLGAAEDPPPRPQLPWAKLMPLGGREDPILLTGQEYTIGRGEAADIQIHDNRVGHAHCRIFYERGSSGPRAEGPYLEDLRSVNGVRVKRAGKRRTRLAAGAVERLMNGDEINVLPLPKKAAARSALPVSFVVVLLDESQDGGSRASGRRAGAKADTTVATAAASPGVAAGQDAAIYGAKSGGGKLLADAYELFETLGAGAHGEVRRARERASGHPCAIKVIRVQKLGQDPRVRLSHLAREAELLRKLDHPGIIRLLDVFEGDCLLCLVMELVEGGDLFDRVIARQRLSEDSARELTRNVLQAVAYLHDEDVVHRDLKLENILMVDRVDDTRVKLTDFGLAAKLNVDGLRTFCGTPQYFAPEVLQRRNTVYGLGRYGREADMWSVGVILYILLSGTPPFRQDRLEQQISQGAFDFTHRVWDAVSRDAKDLIEGLITVDVRGRLTARQALQHRWLSGAPPAAARSQRVERAASCADMDVSQVERLESWRTRFAGGNGGKGLVLPTASPKRPRDDAAAEGGRKRRRGG